MKLLKATAEVTPVVSEEELLRGMNDMLQDELEIQELEHSIEIYEAIFECIEKEGGVSSSLEVMFGENFSSKDTALDELKAQYQAALEGLFDKVRELTSSGRDPLLNGQANDLVKKLTAAKANLDKVSYPITIENGAKINVVNKLSEYIDDFYADVMKLKTVKALEFGQTVRALQSKYEPVRKLFDKEIDGKDGKFKASVSFASAQELGAEIDRIIEGVKKYPTLSNKFHKVIEMIPGLMKLGSVAGDPTPSQKDKEVFFAFVAMHKRFCFMGVHILLKSFIYRGQKILKKLS